MEQLSFLLSWRDEQSFFTAWAPAFDCAPDPQLPGMANWLETENEVAAAEYVRRHGPMWLEYGKRHSVPLTIYAASRFVCVRRLRHGPVKKLSMWDQMEAGDEMLLGSGLTDQSQKMTVAARAMAEKKALGHRS
jgi:hypothetical protein